MAAEIIVLQVAACEIVIHPDYESRASIADLGM